MTKTTCSLKSCRNIIVAFAILYIVWGSTYLAIKVAIETLPPLMMASTRFIVAGILTYCFLPKGERTRPTLEQWRSAAIIGCLLLAAGNGGVVLSEKWIPSGIVSLIVAMTPMVIAILEFFAQRTKAREEQAVGEHQKRLSGESTEPNHMKAKQTATSSVQTESRKIFGLLLGTAGIAMLVSPDSFSSGHMEFLPMGLLLLASLSWSVGSLYSRSAAKPASTMLFVAMQMVCGGLALGALSLLTGEHLTFNIRAVSSASLLALAYLIVFGSILGYGAYIWLLQHVSPTRVSTYAYVNPVIAVLLGWAAAGEPITLRTLAATPLILCAVWLINSKSKATLPQSTQEKQERQLPDDSQPSAQPAIPSTLSAAPATVGVTKGLATTRGHMKG